MRNTLVYLYLLHQLVIWCCLQAYALLYDSVNKDDPTIRIGAIMGLGLAYAGSQKEEVRVIICLIIQSPRPSFCSNLNRATV